MSELSELLERFRRGPELVAMSITGAAGAELDFVPAPGKWSVRQILCHLRIRHLSARPALMAISTACRLSTGNAPGSPRQTGQTLVFGGEPKLVGQPQ